MVGVCEKGHSGGIFFVGQCVLMEWVVRGGEFYGSFGEQGLPVDVQRSQDFTEDALTTSDGNLFQNGTA